MQKYRFSLEFRETGDSFKGHPLLKCDVKGGSLWAYRPMEDMNRFKIFYTLFELKNDILESEGEQ